MAELEGTIASVACPFSNQCADFLINFDLPPHNLDGERSPVKAWLAGIFFAVYWHWLACLPEARRGQLSWGKQMALVPSPQWLDTGDNAWQLAAATFVGLQSIPGLTVLYGGIVKKKWAINSAFMSIYAFASVLIVWVLFDYNMAFGPQWFPFLGTPGLATSAIFTTGQATIPAAAAGMPPLAFPMATLVFFQFVFAAITVIILAGSVLGRMNFTAWMIFCPVWMTRSEEHTSNSSHFQVSRMPSSA